VFAPYSLFSVGPAKTMSTFGDVHEVRADLATLLAFVADGRLSPEVDWRGSWERVSEAARALLDRRIAGKVVLDVGRN
jgi:NADPH2:quinone reductase